MTDTTRALGLQAAVAFLSAKGRLNPYVSGDVIPSPEEIMKLADKFSRWIDSGDITRDHEEVLARMS